MLTCTYNAALDYYCVARSICVHATQRFHVTCDTVVAQGAMQTTEKLLQKPFAVGVPEVSGARPTQAPPPVQRASPSSGQSQGTVGLMLWPAKNKELIITGKKVRTVHMCLALQHCRSSVFTNARF